MNIWIIGTAKLGSATNGWLHWPESVMRATVQPCICYKRAESEEYGIRSDETDIEIVGVCNLTIGFIFLPSSARLRAL